ncbi:glycosyltransferase [Pectinatus frisingensis]|uniref:glycosyltransferase n=1 Tax=Pectinatus frisingensis TaxID=865 RepID=UPI0018C79F0C|nr:glycosyltransferase [Pectinatus frisingensis]
MDIKNILMEYMAANENNFLTAYDEIIKKINFFIAKNDFSMSEKYLRELYKIKPIRIEWLLTYYKFKIKKRENLTDIDWELSRIMSWCIPQGVLCKSILNFKSEIANSYPEKMRLLISREMLYHQNHTLPANLQDEFDQRREIFIAPADNNSNLERLAELYYIFHNDYIAYLFRILMEKDKFIYSKDNREFCRTHQNTVFLYKCIYEYDGAVIIIEEKNNIDDCLVVKKILMLLGKRIYYIKQPVDIEINNDISAGQLLLVSLDNVEYSGETAVYRPITTRKNGVVVKNNTNELLFYIVKKLIRSKWSIVFSSGIMADEISTAKEGCMMAGRLTTFTADYENDKMSISWAGDYLSFISYLYNFDVRGKIYNDEDKYDFSIVIPARNSSATLKYTLQTCIEQTYKGTYEIILSDNSSPGNDAVYELYREIHNDKIHYVKPPYELSLTKSFEFAFLQTSGHFIFSIGSDDAVLPWALSTLANLLPGLDRYNVICWLRGFYAWPNFYKYQRGQMIVELEKQVSIDLLESNLQFFINNPKAMYGMPMLYINSGFRRKYLRVLYEKTNSLWNGSSQDMNMGVINLSINELIPYIKYPLTIAGMAGNSIGYQSTLLQNTGFVKNERAKDICCLCDESVSTYNSLPSERMLINGVGSDVIGLYEVILRCIDLKITKKYAVNDLPWKIIFDNILASITYEDRYFFIYMAKIINCAEIIDEDLGRYVSEAVSKKSRHYYIKDEHKDEPVQKIFMEGLNEEKNVLTIDAEKYNVTNIHEAVQLFVKIVNDFHEKLQKEI